MNIKTIAVKDKIHDTTSFITAPELNSLPKRFDQRTKESAKSLASKSHVDNVRNMKDKKKRRNKKLQMFQLSYFTGKNCFDNYGPQNY